MGVLGVKLQEIKDELIAAITSYAGRGHDTQVQASSMPEPQQCSNVDDNDGSVDVVM